MDIRTLHVLSKALLPAAAVTVLMAGCNSDNPDYDSYDTSNKTVIREAFLSQKVDQIGGATTSVSYFDDGGTEWSLFNMADRLAATPVQTTAGTVSEIRLDDYIRDILITSYGGTDYALVALGSSGIAVVDISDPANMSVLHTLPVNYYQDGITFAEGGGALVTDVVLEGANGFIKSLETDGTTVWIGNEDYGIHRTTLAKVIGGTVEVADNTLEVDDEVYTLQYAGEHPWGAPHDLQLHDGLLYAAVGFLGLGIYDPVTLDRVGSYNMYTDTSVTEDWFINMDVTAEVQPDGTDGVATYIDAETGMPNYHQASFEILDVWHGSVDQPTPWADFDRYGKYYYNAHALDVTGTGANVQVYLAYGLGGLVAVDVDASTPSAPTTSYSAYAPAVPAHGPDSPTGEQSKSLFPYFGAGMLKEAGVIDVSLDAANNRVFYADHFAGLVVLEGADDPAANWIQGTGGFDNDTIGDLGDHWPDYEFVTSYDMAPNDPTDNESLPAWMFASNGPALLVSGEISGHGNALFLMPTISETTGNIDAVQATGSGGLNFIDIGNLAETAMEDRFSAPVYFASTDEVGAAADGSATVKMAIGHTQGVTTTGKYLYVADGPHGMSVWQIGDDNGLPVEPHVVANTLVAEYAVDNAGTTVYPTPHAYNIVLASDNQHAYVLSQSLGLRRVDISAAEAGVGTVGAPLLLTPQPSDFYEHNTTSGSYLGIKRQDHAYDVEMYGNYAVVADGSNGLTVYDLTQNPDPAVTAGEHVVDNLGSASGNPLLGRPSGVDLWTNPADNRIYAFVAAGHAGVAVVDMTEILANNTAGQMELIKVFEPIKIEDDSIGKADSRSVDVHVIGDHAYYSYGGFGIVAYSIEDMLAPLPTGVEPDKIWKKGDFDHRPEAVAQYVLNDEPGLEDTDPEALYMTPQYMSTSALINSGTGVLYSLDEPKLIFYVAYGGAGVAKIDWSDPANPVLLQHQDTVGEATGTAIAHGRVYVSDHEGGLVYFD